jgi:hypothetical protein
MLAALKNHYISTAYEYRQAPRMSQAEKGSGDYGIAEASAHQVSKITVTVHPSAACRTNRLW